MVRLHATKSVEEYEDEHSIGIYKSRMGMAWRDQGGRGVLCIDREVA